MIDPISPFFLALDRGVERISDRAFKAAVSGHNERVEEPIGDQERLLGVIAEREGRDIPRTSELADLVRSGYVVENDAGQIDLTALGQYLLPETRNGSDQENSPLASSH
jgi:hypothetical protein